MPTFGIHAFVWNGEWNNDIAPVTIRKTAEAGFDHLEIPILRPAEFDAALVLAELKKYKLRAVASLGLPKDAHLPFYPEKALAFLKLAVDKVAAIESDTLSGCIYCNLGTMTGQPPTQAERDTVLNVIGELNHYAKPKGVRLGFEPVNRYETYLYNIGADALALINAIDPQNMFLHFDTYHMNIEENGMGAAIRAAGSLCQYIHMSESNRGIPGEGNVHWDETFQGLKDINYRGPLVLEAFADVNPDLAGATCMWRPSAYNGEQLAVQGLAFLREKAERIGLA